MGIQINGQTDTITATDGSFTLGGTVTAKVAATTDGVIVATGATISGSTNTIIASTNGSERVRITSSGNVGIGTDNPSNKLTVGTNPIGYSSYAFIHNPSGADSTTRAELSDNATLTIQPHATNSTHMSIGQVNGGYGIGVQVTNYDKSADWNICLNPFGGAVGIKTTAPAATLDVRGGAYLSPLLLSSSYSSWVNSTYGAISNSTVSSLNNLLIGQNMRGYLNSDGGSVNNNFYSTVTYSSSTMGHAGIEFCYGGITKFYNDSAASTANATFTPIEKMRVTPSSNSGMVIISDTGNTYSAGGTNYSSYGVLQVTGSQAGISVRDSNSGVYRSIYTNSSGNCYFYNGTNEGFLSSAGAWTNASDERLKQNIRPIGYGLTAALSLTPRHYEMKDNNETNIGFIAQEVEEIIPEVVSSSDGATGYKGLDYGSLVAVAIKAIQELKEENDSLRARLDAAGI